ncbi:hypothetical protein SNEBB_008569 [Seison nebaliae]|nr:hypothetical protein SNEBB_008569 [Seison nebaliae]
MKDNKQAILEIAHETDRLRKLREEMDIEKKAREQRDAERAEEARMQREERGERMREKEEKEKEEKEIRRREKEERAKQERKRGEEMMSNMNNNIEKMEETLVKKVAEQIKADTKEEEEKEKRKRNIVLYNVQESHKTEGEQRKKDDEKMCKELFDVIDVQNAEIENCFRMGKKEEGRKRPLLVILKETKSKFEVLKNARNLRNANEELRMIGIMKDQTKKEMEESRKVRNELRQRRDNGETDIVIKNGKVVKRTVYQDRR